MRPATLLRVAFALLGTLGAVVTGCRIERTTTPGGLHALGRFLTRELERTGFYRTKVPRLVKQLLVFSFVTFTWIFFRAASLDDALLILTKIFSDGFPMYFNRGRYVFQNR